MIKSKTKHKKNHVYDVGSSEMDDDDDADAHASSSAAAAPPDLFFHWRSAHRTTANQPSLTQHPTVVQMLMVVVSLSR